jgi:DNA-binding SARP family transcriptional activator
VSREAEVMRVWLLGGLCVLVRSRVVGDGSWRLRKAADLVKLLALAPNHCLHREQVIELAAVCR